MNTCGHVQLEIRRKSEAPSDPGITIIMRQGGVGCSQEMSYTFGDIYTFDRLFFNKVKELREQALKIPNCTD